MRKGVQPSRCDAYAARPKGEDGDTPGGDERKRLRLRMLCDGSSGRDTIATMFQCGCEVECMVKE